jgi:predicted Zn-dependent peptidase
MDDSNVKSGYLTENTRVYKKILSNGVHCVVIAKKGYKQKNAMLAVRYGSADTDFEVNGERIGQVSGIAHFLEHKMFECENGDAMTEFTKNHADANAFTNADTTAYHFTCVDNFEENLELLCNMVNSLCVSKESVENEKKIIGSEINMYGDDAPWKCYFSLLKAMYGKNAIGNEIAGTEDSIENISVSALETAYNSFYTAENMVLVAVGDLDENAVFEQAENLLDVKNGGSVKRIAEKDDIKQNEVNISMPSVTPCFNIGFRIDEVYSLFNQAVYEVVAEMLTGSSSDLYEKLYEKRLTDFPLNYTTVAANGAFALILSGEGENGSEIAKMLVDEIGSLKANGVDEACVKRICKKLAFSVRKNIDDISYLSSKAADCFVKNLEILDICEIYGKINREAVECALDGLCEKNMVISKIGG